MKPSNISYFYLDLPWLSEMWPVRLSHDGTGNLRRMSVARLHAPPPEETYYNDALQTFPDSHTFVFNPKTLSLDQGDFSFWLAHNARARDHEHVPKFPWIISESLANILHEHSHNEVAVLNGPPQEDLESMAILVAKMEIRSLNCSRQLHPSIPKNTIRNPVKKSYFKHHSNSKSTQFEKSIIERWPDMIVLTPQFASQVLTERLLSSLDIQCSSFPENEREVLSVLSAIEKYRAKYDLGALF